MPVCQIGRLSGWCGQCYSGLRGRRTYAGHYGYRKDAKHAKGQTMAVHRRGSPGQGNNAGPGPIELCGLCLLYPDLTDFLVRTRWSDSESRVPGTIMLFAEAGVWKGWLHDRDASLGAFVAGATLTEVLVASDKIAGSAGGDWRPDKKSPVRR